MFCQILAYTSGSKIRGKGAKKRDASLAGPVGNLLRSKDIKIKSDLLRCPSDRFQFLT
jgi:hypothetical protein